LSGISSSLWKMFKSLKKKPEKAKEAIDFKLKFHATRVCYVCVSVSQFFFELLFFGACMVIFGSDLCTIECSYGMCLSVRAVSLVCLHQECTCRALDGCTDDFGKCKILQFLCAKSEADDFFGPERSFNSSCKSASNSSQKNQSNLFIVAQTMVHLGFHKNSHMYCKI
jgi:hypothetical protein